MEAYALTQEAAAWVVAKSKERPGLHSAGAPLQYQADERERVWIENTSGETIPAFGVVVATGASKTDGIWYIEVTKPSTSIKTVLVNGQYDIEPGKRGWAYYGPIVEVLYNDTSPTSEAGWGVDGFKLKKYPTGEPIAWFTVIGIANPAYSTVYAKLEPLDGLLIKAPSGGIPGRAGNILQGVTCKAMVTETSGDVLHESNVSLKVYNWTKTTVCENGDRYGVAKKINGKWQIIAEDCNDEGSVIEPLKTTIAISAVPNPVDTQVNGFSTFGQMGTVSYTIGAAPIP